MCKKAPYGRCANAAAKAVNRAGEALTEAKKAFSAAQSPMEREEALQVLEDKEQDLLRAIAYSGVSDVPVPKGYEDYKAKVVAEATVVRSNAIAAYEGVNDHPVAREDKRYARIAGSLATDLDELTEATVALNALEDGEGRKGKNYSSAETEYLIKGSLVARKMDFLRDKQVEWDTKNLVSERNPYHTPEREGIIVEETQEDGTVKTYGVRADTMREETLTAKRQEYLDKAKDSDGKIKVYEAEIASYTLGTEAERPSEWEQPTDNYFWVNEEVFANGYKMIQDNGEQLYSHGGYRQSEVETVTKNAEEENKSARSAAGKDSAIGEEVYNLKEQITNTRIVPFRTEYQEVRTLIS